MKPLGTSAIQELGVKARGFGAMALRCLKA